MGCKGGGVIVSGPFFIVESRRWLPKLESEIAGLIGEDWMVCGSLGAADFY